mgnify:FL=1
MTTNKLSFTNTIQKKNLKSKSLKNLSSNFDKAMKEINNDIKSTRQTLNILDKNFKYNFSLNDLSKFKKFNTIIVIGMGGSILGAEAIHGFFKEKIKKKFTL